MSSPGETASQTIRAGDKEGVQIILGATTPTVTRVNVEIFDYVTGKKFLTLKDVTVKDNRLQLTPETLSNIIQKSGRYTISLESGEIAGEARFTIIPAEPHHISAETSSLLLQDKTQALTLSVRDIFENPIQLTDWTLDMTTNDPIILSGFGEDARTKFQGKVPGNVLNFIPKKSGNTTFTISLTKDQTVLRTSLSKPVLADIKLVAQIEEKNLTVGQTVPVHLSVQRADGSIVDTWDMPVTLGVRGGDAKLTNTKIQFEKGKATTTLNTGTKSAQIQLYLSDTILGNFVGDTFTILPGAPEQIVLNGPEILYARSDSSDFLTLQLRDKYGNLTDLQ